MDTPQNPLPNDTAPPGVADAVLAQFKLEGADCLVVLDDSRFGRMLGTGAHSVVRLLGRMDMNGQRYAIYARTEERRAAPPQPDPLALLTARELQIIRLVCLGCVNKQIAHKLRISEYTVKTYLKQIFCKLNVHSRSAMVYRCAGWSAVERPRERAAVCERDGAA